MFAHTLQPSTISLFSSTSSHPTILASNLRTSPSFPSDSFISLVQDATDEELALLSWSDEFTVAADQTRIMKGKGKEVDRRNLRSRVLHLQAPDVRSTSLKLGARRGKEALGIKLPWLHLAVKDLGQLFYFEVTVVDERGQLVIIRASTWQSTPKFHPPTPSHPPLLHIPLHFPSPTPHRLTPWTTIALHLPPLLSSLPSLGGPHLARFSALQLVEVHANCRLRRIWCTEDGKLVEEGMAARGMQAELALFEAPHEGAEGGR